jgi:nucleoside-diphosphate-sugar epimerase
MVGDGTQRVDLVHVDDLSRLLLRALEEPRAIGRAYNVTNPDNPSWNELLEAVEGELGVRTPVRHLPHALAFALAGLLELASAVTGTEPRLTRYSVRVMGKNYNYVADAAQSDIGFGDSIALPEGGRGCLGALSSP